MTTIDSFPSNPPSWSGPRCGNGDRIGSLGSRLTRTIPRSGLARAKWVAGWLAAPLPGDSTRADQRDILQLDGRPMTPCESAVATTEPQRVRPFSHGARTGRTGPEGRTAHTTRRPGPSRLRSGPGLSSFGFGFGVRALADRGDERGEGVPLEVVIWSRRPRPVCEVGGGSVWSKGFRTVVLVDLPAFGRPVRLRWRKRALDVPEPWVCAPVSP